MAEKWCAIKKAGVTVSHEYAADGSITPPDGCTVEYFDTPQSDLIAEVDAGMVSSKLTTMLGVDASLESGTTKAILEFLQEKFS